LTVATYQPSQTLCSREPEEHAQTIDDGLFVSPPAVRLKQTENVLTVNITTNGNLNLAYFDFKLIHK
jgi:hypothetical protein